MKVTLPISGTVVSGIGRTDPPPFSKYPVLLPITQPTHPRLTVRCGFGTMAGLSGPGVTKVNQDTAVVAPCFCRNKESHFFAVADGHGNFGEHISAIIKQSLPSTILCITVGRLEKALLSLEESQALKEAYMKMSKDVRGSKVDARHR